MRPFLQILAATVLLAGLAGGQAMTEAAAAITGSTVGSAAGKGVSQGIDSIFRKVDSQMKNAAGTPPPPPAEQEPQVQVGAPVQGAPIRTYSVPPPPPLRPARRAARPQAVVAAARVEPVIAIAPAPPLPKVTADMLASLEPGTRREEVVKLGASGVRISMFDDGHLIEILSYPGGSVRLNDGLVESVKLR